VCPAIIQRVKRDARGKPEWHLRAHNDHGVMMTAMMTAMMSNHYNLLSHKRLQSHQGGSGEKYCKSDETFHYDVLLARSMHFRRQALR